jgi:hypothetical protein
MSDKKMIFSRIEFVPEDSSYSQNSPLPRNLSKIGKKKESRSKHPKTIHQVILLKYFFHVMDKADRKREVVDLIQRHTGFSQRQIYKWMWDETLRIRQRSESQNDYFKEKNGEAFNQMLKAFSDRFSNSTTYVLESVIVPEVRNLSLGNSEFVWKVKLRELFNSTIMLQKNNE